MAEFFGKRTFQAAVYVIAIMICTAPAAAQPAKCEVAAEADFKAMFDQIANAANTESELFDAEMRLADLVERCRALTADGGRRTRGAPGAGEIASCQT